MKAPAENQLFKILTGFIFLLLFCAPSLQAQLPIGIGTLYNNSFREWTITTDDEDIRGNLHMRWTFSDDWTAWDFDIGDVHGTIDQKWKEEPDLWEIKCNGVIVTARTAWPGEFYRWKLTDGHQQYNWYTRYASQPTEWMTDEGKNGFFQVYTYYENDAREWVIKDELPEDTSMAMRMAMIFMALHFSTPRS
jgi:hypothetical protein